MKTRMAYQKILDFVAPMNWMLVPDHHDRTTNAPEQMLQKGNAFIAGDRLAIGLKVQFDFAFPRTHA